MDEGRKFSSLPDALSALVTALFEIFIYITLKSEYGENNNSSDHDPATDKYSRLLELPANIIL